MAPPFLQTVKEQLFSFKTLFFSLIISAIYFSFSILILNLRFLSSSLLSNSPIVYKLRIVLILLQGAYSAFSPSDFYLLILTSALVGLNVLILIKLLNELNQNRNKLTFVVGGSTVLGVVVAGCTSCGFSVISILGFTSALSFIPFGGLGIHLVVISLLVVSLLYSLKTYHEKIACKLR